MLFRSYDPKSPANKDSALVWAHGGLIEPRPEKTREARFGSTMSTASIHDGLVYIAEERGYLHCLDQKTGQEYWTHDMFAAVWGSTLVVDGKVYLGDEDGDVTILQAGKEKKVLGEMNMGSAVYATPVPAHGALFLNNRNQLFALAANAGTK